MGKSKGFRRTKGNTRPSNSDHSAQLLNSSGKPLLGLLSFSGLKTTGLNDDANIDSSFAMVLKKMLKRDAITKLKALQEFKDLCDKNEKDVILSILPFWPRIFNRLALDLDRRVREATIEANGKLIQKVKRDIAPYLRCIMGVWLLCQCDIYSPAAAAAQHTFDNAFSQEKQSEVLMFCHEEIIAYFKDNLFEQTPESLSDPNTTSEEIENKFVLIVSGSINAIRIFLNKVSKDDQKILCEDMKKIVSENKFWKFAKNVNTQVRSSWYYLVSCLCSIMPEVFQNYERKLGSAILGCISEKDSTVASAVWETVLNYIVKFETCWETVDINKVFLPKLWSLLREGGAGNAAILFPCLLPLLSRLPPKITDSGFFENFFSNIRCSLTLDAVKKSSVECNAIITAFIECFEYVLHRYLDNSNDLLESLVKYQIMPVLKNSFMADGSHLPISQLYPMLGSLVQKMERCIIHGNSTNLNTVFSHTLNLFWVEAIVIFSDVLNDDHLSQTENLAFLAYFFHCLYEPYSTSNKQNLKSSHSNNNQEVQRGILSAKQVKFNCKFLSPSEFPRLFQSTAEFCCAIYTKIKEKFESPCVKLLSEILSAAHCSYLFQVLLKKNDFYVEDESKSPVIFFENIVSLWIPKALNNEAIINSIGDIIFTICACVEENAALNILDKCCKVEYSTLLHVIVKKGFYEHRDDKIFHKWLTSSTLSCHIYQLVQEVISVCTAGDLINFPKIQLYTQTISSCLVCCHTDDIKKPILGSTYVQDIISALQEGIEYILIQTESWAQCNYILLDFICRVATIIFKSYKDSIDSFAAITLVSSAFTLSLSVKLSDEYYQKMSAFLQLCVEEYTKTSCHFQIDGFFNKISKLLNSVLINCSSDAMSNRVVDHILLLLFSFHKYCTLECYDDEESENVISLCIKEILPSENNWLTLRNELNLDILHSYFERKLFYPLPSKTEISVLSTSIPQHIFLAKLSSDIIVNFLELEGKKDYMHFMINHIIHQLPHLLWSFSYCDIAGYLKKEGTSEYSCARTLQKNCFKIVAFLPLDKVIKIVKNIYSLCIDNGIQWSLPLQNVIEISKTLHPEITSYCSELLEETNKCTIAVNNCIVRQVLVFHVSKEKRRMLLRTLIPKLLAFEEKKFQLDILAEICCCLQENDINDDPELQSCIADLLISVFKAKSFLLDKEYIYMFVIQMESILSSLIKTSFVFSASQWELILDFMLLSLKECEGIKHYSNSADLLVVHQTCSFLCLVCSMIFDDCKSCQYKNLIIKTEWRISLLEKLAKGILPFFLCLSENCQKMESIPLVIESVLAVASQAIEFLTTEQLLDAMFEPFNSDSKTEKNESIFEKCISLLTSSIRPVHFGVHSFLMKIMPMLPEYFQKLDGNVIENSENVMENSELIIRLYPLLELIEHTSQIVESMLMDVKTGDCCIVVPYTDSYTYTMAYLLAWNELMEFFSAASSEQRSSYVIYLEDKKLLTSLLNNLFRIMPENPNLCCQDYNEDTQSVKDLLKRVFVDQPIMSSLGTPKTSELQHIACKLYYCILKKVPALVRTWWNNLDKKAADVVNRFTTTYISALLSAEEIQTVQENVIEFSNMTVRARLPSREVIATYTLDDSTIELSIQLPTNYPLGTVVTERRGKVGITTPQWRHWLMQLTTFLIYQNGSILDGLILWKKNLDKKFEGIEECMICYYILHSSSSKLPKLSCRTCKKKFHSDCLYKWFSTSNNSTCPLCRNYF